MINNLTAASLTGYYIGIAVECVIIVLAAVILALLLTGLLFKWAAILSERREERKARREAERAEREAARLAAEEEAARLAEEEAARQAEEAAMAELEEPVEEVEEEQPEVVEEVETVIVKKKIVKVVEEVEEEKPQPQPEPQPEPEPVEVAEEEDGEKGIVFAESKTITELYEELTSEQKSYFDELREEALTKPDAELSMSRNFIAVKIGKRNLIKLLIKRGVTVAEFMLENEALKQLRLSNRNKRGGKSTIKVKPTVVQVLDLPSLKVAVDMINLAYEELMLSE